MQEGNFTTKCSWSEVKRVAKEEARKIGGNALKIVKHIRPNKMGNSCHQIMATILKVYNFDDIKPVASKIANADYYLLHFYRPKGGGSLISYSIHIDDKVVAKTKNNWKRTIQLSEEGVKKI